jgi:catalase
VGEGVELLSLVGVSRDAASAPAGVVVAETPVTNLGDTTAATDIATSFIAAIAKHRHWDRANIDAVPA